MTPAQTIEIYTDGSCHIDHRVGVWVSLIKCGEERHILTGNEKNTTHQRMELTAIIKALQFLKERQLTLNQIYILTDSQFVIGLQARMEKLKRSDYISAKGKLNANADLIKNFYQCLTSLNIKFFKVKAHSRDRDGHEINREVDMLCRKEMRALVDRL